jgi:transcriptional regulator with XRE-family HTH domain
MSGESGPLEAGDHWARTSTPAARIAAARRAAGLSQRELAVLVGTDLWTVHELESGRKDSRSYASRIEAALGKPAGWINAENGNPAIHRESSPELSSGLSNADRLARNLVLFTLIAMITVRFFTEQIGVLPLGGNFIDIVLLPILVIAVIVRSQETAISRSPLTSELLLLGLLFFAVCTLSVALNTSRISSGPVLIFFYGFLGPLGFYVATRRLWPSGQAIVLSRTLIWLGVSQFIVIGLLDLPSFLATGNPDEIVGTFGGNAYQLVFFLLVFAALVSGIATFESRRRTARFAPLLLGATFLTIFLAQYRALLAATALTVLLVGFMLGRSRGKGFVVGALGVTAFVAGLGYVAIAFPTNKFSPTIEAARNDPALFLTARLAPARDVLTLYGDDPRFVVIGSGPGTYSSRAWSTFASVGDPASSEGAAQSYASALTGGVAYHTDVADKYVVPRLREAPAILGSRALTSPHSSYLALLAETGLLGFILLVLMYGRALLHAGSRMLARAREQRRDDPLPALLLATTVAFFVVLQMAFLENWLEVARVTIPSWMLLAVCVKELESSPRGREQMPT